jgi:hypothetical protein
MAQVSELEVVVGGYYYSKRDAVYRVSKVLAVTPGIVHLRSYRNIFTSPPTANDIPSLTIMMTMEDLMALTKDPKKAGPIGIGHAPISRAGFLDEAPVLFATGPVDDAELDGYRDWRRAMGDDESSQRSPSSASWFRRLFRRGGGREH